MSIRERAKKRSKSVVEPQHATETVPNDSTSEEVVPDKVNSTSNEVVSDKVDSSPADFFAAEIPSWVKKPWMYVQPKHVNQLQSWLDSWSDLIIAYCRIYKAHIITVAELTTEHPFSNKLSSRKLSRDQMRAIISKMVEEGLAKWLDDNQIRARIYYKTTDEWADIIYDYMMDTGKAIEVQTLFEFVNMEQEWSDLPREELQVIMDKFVSSNKAKYVTSDHDAIEFVI